MLKSVKRVGEFVSLSVMLLLIATLVASQADARHSEQARPGPVVEHTQGLNHVNTPLKTTIKAHFVGKRLTISVDPVSGFGNLRFIFE